MSNSEIFQSSFSLLLRVRNVRYYIFPGCMCITRGDAASGNLPSDFGNPRGVLVRAIYLSGPGDVKRSAGTIYFAYREMLKPRARDEDYFSGEVTRRISRSKIVHESCADFLFFFLVFLVIFGLVGGFHLRYIAPCKSPVK